MKVAIKRERKDLTRNERNFQTEFEII